jgi:hypothetical protein
LTGIVVTHVTAHLGDLIPLFPGVKVFRTSIRTTSEHRQSEDRHSCSEHSLQGVHGGV